MFEMEEADRERTFTAWSCCFSLPLTKNKIRTPRRAHKDCKQIHFRILWCSIYNQVYDYVPLGELCQGFD